MSAFEKPIPGKPILNKIKNTTSKKKVENKDDDNDDDDVDLENYEEEKEKNEELERKISEDIKKSLNTNPLPEVIIPEPGSLISGSLSTNVQPSEPQTFGQPSGPQTNVQPSGPETNVQPSGPQTNGQPPRQNRVPKLVSILIIGHGNLLFEKDPIAYTNPLCLTKYIVPFGNTAFLTRDEDIAGLRGYINTPSQKINNREEFMSFMNTVSDNIIPKIYNQESYTTKMKQPINYARTKTVISNVQLNKKYKFYDIFSKTLTRSEIIPNHGDLKIGDKVFTPSNEIQNGDIYSINSDGTYKIRYYHAPLIYGVFILHNNIGIPIGSKLNIQANNCTLDNIINHRQFNGFEGNDFFYIIDTTCNSFSQGEEIPTMRTVRQKARFYDSFFNAIENDKKYGFDIFKYNSFFRRWSKVLPEELRKRPELRNGGKKKKKTKKNTKKNTKNNKKRRL
jgi:hypothetical protein